MKKNGLVISLNFEGYISPKSLFTYPHFLIAIVEIIEVIDKNKMLNYVNMKCNQTLLKSYICVQVYLDRCN